MRGRKGAGTSREPVVEGGTTESPQMAIDGLEVSTEKGKKRRALKFDHQFGEVTSAMQKEIRRGDERAAVFWALLLHDVAPQYTWKRLVICAAEDVGFAAPDVVAQVNALAAGWEFCKRYSQYYVDPQSLVMAVMLLCRAAKSTEVCDLKDLTLEEIKQGKDRPILEEYLDGHTEAGKAAGKTWAEWYADRHRRFGIQVNQYTRQLWALKPQWNPEGAVAEQPIHHD